MIATNVAAFAHSQTTALLRRYRRFRAAYRQHPFGTVIALGLTSTKGVTLVLRITAVNGSTRTTLKVEGKLTRHNVGEFARMCLPHLGQPASLHLDFSSVSFVDDAGAIVMRDLLRRNVTIRGCSQLISHILKEHVS